MNKGELIGAVASGLRLSRSDATRAVEAVLASISEGLRTDHKVSLSGFGTFTRQRRPPRRGLNPATGQPMTIGETTTCGFRPAPALRQVLGHQPPEIKTFPAITSAPRPPAKAAAPDGQAAPRAGPPPA